MNVGILPLFGVSFYCYRLLYSAFGGVAQLMFVVPHKGWNIGTAQIAQLVEAVVLVLGFWASVIYCLL